jgi:hypothetical protein
MNETQNSTRLTTAIVGSLFLGGFLAYGTGSSITAAIIAVPNSSAQATGNPLFTVGALLMLANSAVVLGIGILLFPILERHSSVIALGYLGTRIFEAVVLAIGVIYLLASAPAGNVFAYNLAMVGLGIGSLFFCALLVMSRLVPRFLAVWGFVGYAAFTAGSVLEILGVAGSGLVAAIPGGLFEVSLGIWLIAKGFNQVTPAPAGRPGTATFPELVN